MPDGEFLSAAGRGKIRRRQAVVEQALKHFRGALRSIPHIRPGTSEKLISSASKPLAAAKNLIKEFKKRKPRKRPTKLRDRQALISEAVALELGTSWPSDYEGPPQKFTAPDFSAATEARASLLRRQPEHLQSFVMYDDDLGEVEHRLLRREIKQTDFNRICKSISRRSLGWMADHKPKPNPPKLTPIERIPQDVLHKALGCGS